MGVRHEFSGRQKRKQGMGEGESPVSEFFFFENRFPAVKVTISVRFQI